MVYPYLTYCNLVWGGASETNLRKILLLQKRCVRIITASHFLDPSAPLFSSTSILTIHNLYSYLCLLHAFKYKDSLTERDSRYNTRHGEAYSISFQRISVCQRSLKFIVPKLYNELPLRIKSIDTLGIFKKEIKNFVTSGQI